MSGKVYLIGAGPGDPGLITIKGKKLIEECDVVIFDRLANELFLTYARDDAELIYAGKDNTEGGKSQDATNKLMVSKALSGKSVARVKGGDPFMYGRGGEEAEVLKSAGINYEIVPGVSSLTAVPAYAGIPVTHRGVSSEVHVYSGNSRNGSPDIDYEKTAQLSGTKVIFMGTGELKNIIKNLIAGGMKPETPAAVIENGTTNFQRSVTGTAADIVYKTSESGIKPPALVVIGECALLSEKLGWFEPDGTLGGRRVAVTRDLSRSRDFAEMIHNAGGKPEIFPLIKIEYMEVKVDLSGYSGIVFASANGVRAFMNTITDIRELSGCKIGAMGEVTAKELAKNRIKPDFVPDEFNKNALFEKCREEFAKGEKVLYVTSGLAKHDFSVEFEKSGIIYEAGIFYRTSKIKKDEAEKERFIKNSPEYITFFSASAVDSFFENFEPEQFPAAKYVTMGYDTSQAMKRHGVFNFKEAKKATGKGILEAVIDDLQK